MERIVYVAAGLTVSELTSSASDFLPCARPAAPGFGTGRSHPEKPARSSRRSNVRPACNVCPSGEIVNQRPSPVPCTANSFGNVLIASIYVEPATITKKNVPAVKSGRAERHREREVAALTRNGSVLT